MSKRFWISFTLIAIVLGSRGFRPDPALALTNTTCPGNVCSASVVLGGQTINYSWTQNHNAADSSLKIRFKSGPYTSSISPVRFIITVGQPFASNASLKNPSPLFSMPPDQTVNGTQTIITRSSTSSTLGTSYDFTQELRYGLIVPGTVSVIVQFDAYGFSTSASFNVYFDAASPSNRDESQSLAALYGAGYRQCYDVVDQDLDYRTDCADSNCTGVTIAPGSFCEAPETTCSDGYDNDGSGAIDCADPLCNGRPASMAGKFCGSENGGASHINCADAFDNDGNGKIDCKDDAPGTGCWKSGFQDCAKTEISCTDGIDNDRDSDYSSALDTVAGTGVDCTDYDCKNQGNCTQSENKRWVPGPPGPGGFVDDPNQCFDGQDNDLDGLNDCTDPDCLGLTIPGPPIKRCAGFEAYLPPSPLGTGDPLPKFYFNYCSDGANNDGDAQGADELDADCKNVFGECGPSPAIEDYTFFSCSDTKDNNLNGSADCADSACRTSGKIGRAGCFNSTCGAPAKFATTQTDAAACAATEASASVCGDGLDNNANGQLDCSDAACNGVRHGPTVGTSGAPYLCGTESGAATCHDGADNDSDLGTDCFDTACQDGTQCKQRPGAGGWTLAPSCPIIPDTTALSSIASGGAVQYAHDDRIYVNTPYRLRFTGSGSYSSLTIVIGDAAVPANAFPFNAGNCTLTGSGAPQMQYASSSAAVGVINELSGQTLTNFDVTLTCAVSSAVPVGPQSYKVSVVANHAGVVEFGESSPSVQVFESTVPTLPNPAIEAEGIVVPPGKVDVPVGGTVRFQATPSTDPSGICRCDFNLNGVAASSADGNCAAAVGPFANDNNAYTFQAAAIDGASNKSATSTVQTIKINVVPTVAEDLYLGADGNGATVYTYRGNDAISLWTTFQTDTLSTFPLASNCRVYVYDKTWTGGAAATAAMVPITLANVMTCQGVYTVPAALAAGRYSLFVEATDSGGDIVRSNVQNFLKCENADVGTGDCKDADFDHDGAPEGRFTPAGYSSPPTPTYPGAQPKACDDCINFYNPNQSDSNANGVGDACEASLIGRCQYKYCGSAPNAATLPLTACSADSDCTSPDLCLVVDQPMCTVNCAADSDCRPPTTTQVGVCKLDWGACDTGADQGNCCFTNSDCLSGTCKALVKPFIQTMSGQIYTGGQLQAGETPPIYNATFCLQSNGAITNFTSAAGCTLAGSPAYTYPDKSKNYVGSFGTIDVNGILNGKFGTLSTPVQPPTQLAGGIYYFPTGLATTSALNFLNSAGAARANGLVIVKGDLNINFDLSYQDRNESDLKNLASVGWIVLKDSSGNGGNVKIAGSVNKVVGAFYAENSIDTGNGTGPLDATGAFVARNFSFGRQYASRTSGSERMTFDARLVLNPPPGMSDATRSLPGFRSIPGQ